MHKLFNALVVFLREPAVQTIIAIVGLLAVVGGSIAGWFNGIIALLSTSFPWLAKANLWVNWQIAGLLILVFVFLAAWLRAGPLRGRHRAPPMVPHVTYRKVWGILWGWPPPPGRLIGDGPLCPDHKLPLSVKKVELRRSERRYDFVCPGPEDHNSHTIAGPMFTQLVPSTDGWGQNDPNIYRDVNARIRAEELAQRT